MKKLFIVLGVLAAGVAVWFIARGAAPASAQGLPPPSAAPTPTPVPAPVPVSAVPIYQTSTAGANGGGSSSGSPVHAVPIYQTSTAGANGGGLLGTAAPVAGASGGGALGLVPVYKVPSSSVITIQTQSGGIPLNNFYSSALGAQDEFVVLARTGSYEIDYDTYTSGFDIDILGGSLSADQPPAEAAFLAMLGIAKTNACRLTVAVSETAVSSTMRLPLSFCASSSAFSQ